MIQPAKLIILKELMGLAIKIIGYAGLAGDSGCKMCSAYEDSIVPMAKQAHEMVDRIEILIKAEGGTLCD